ncbi:translation initiation factor eIF 4e-like domain-containing protein [Naematelia encephala]|uniref:Translation initiation factor eIF 4e-like domain-containing protein n=1 Tax=Naematelia encephala TaxID=71784 RepID=A0A1Y2BDW2_9TREE|nr:translation initiation factor eIF 4e-like domain-containing protein [Naematelia encephala]
MSTTASSSSALSTPESAKLGTPLPEDLPPPSTKFDKMFPPPLPVNIVEPTPPRMTRLPSLQQLSTRFAASHISSSPTTSMASPTPIDPISPTSSTGTSKPSTPPRPPLSTSASPVTPSGRLKLPASAMMRSLSHSEADSGTSMSREPSREGFIKGYKDVPSLTAIRQRMSISRPSAGEPVKKPEGMGSGPQEDKIVAQANMPVGEQTKLQEASVKPPVAVQATHTQAVNGAKEDMSPLAESASCSVSPLTKTKQHPLRHEWTLYYDSKSFKPDPAQSTPKDGQAFLGDYEKGLLTVGSFDTVEGFARYANNIRLPSQLARNSNYHLFKNGIRPMWEDPANANGGKWIVLFRSAPHLLDIGWANLFMSLIGEILDPSDEVCGIVASTRPKVDRLQVWTRGREDVEALNALGRRIVDCLALERGEVESMSLEFQYNSSNSTPPPGKFMHIPFSARPSFSHAPPTPSRLGATSMGPPPSPRSPTPLSAMLPPKPVAVRTTDTLAPPAQGMKRVQSGQGANAFAGPMGGGRGSLSGSQGGVKREGIVGS